jgi:hypothetical protein
MENINKCIVALSDCLRDYKKLNHMKENINRVDGAIIGTGESDFTKGNIQYDFKLQNGDFRIIDVPGIEGDENRIEEYVKEAIAKAHLVFYVNGTNKKPETKTAEKIRGYLRDDSYVYAICNVRGKADSYEFDEDRERLDLTHRSAIDAKKQTFDVLDEILDDKLQGICNVQGLLAFTSLAIHGNEYSSIADSREHDLGKAQKKFLKYFKKHTSMKEFSQISMLTNFINDKARSFEEDIIESNKSKIINRIKLALNDLVILKNIHSKLIDKLCEEVRVYLERISVHQKVFEHSYKKKMTIIVDEFLVNFQEKIIDEFDRKTFKIETAESNINKIYAEMEIDLNKSLEDESKKMYLDLEKEINKSLEWLQSDLETYVRYTEMKHIDFDTSIFVDAMDEMKLKVKDYLIYILDVGQFVFDAVLLAMKSGNPYVVVVAGISTFLMKLGIVIKDVTIGRKREIRNKVRKHLDDKIKEIKNSYKKELESISTDAYRSIDKMIDETIISKLDDEILNFKEAEKILSVQIQEITSVKNHIEEMGYGTIQ